MTTNTHDTAAITARDRFFEFPFIMLDAILCVVMFVLPFRSTPNDQAFVIAVSCLIITGLWFTRQIYKLPLHPDGKSWLDLINQIEGTIGRSLALTGVYLLIWPWMGNVEDATLIVGLSIFVLTCWCAGTKDWDAPQHLTHATLMTPVLATSLVTALFGLAATGVMLGVYVVSYLFIIPSLWLATKCDLRPSP
jgi:hypothetical protein